MSRLPWYRDGLKFECTGCGQCCTGAPGYVWVTGEEIAVLANELSMDVPDFERKFVRAVGKRKSLVERANGDCVFFDGTTRRCRLYAIRPAQCGTWPFWESNLESAEAWQEVTDTCPGSGHGRTFSREEIDSRAAKIRI